MASSREASAGILDRVDPAYVVIARTAPPALPAERVRWIAQDLQAQVWAG